MIPTIFIANLIIFGDMTRHWNLKALLKTTIQEFSPNFIVIGQTIFYFITNILKGYGRNPPIPSQNRVNRVNYIWGPTVKTQITGLFSVLNGKYLWPMDSEWAGWKAQTWNFKRFRFSSGKIGKFSGKTEFFKFQCQGDPYPVSDWLIGKHLQLIIIM